MNTSVQQAANLNNQGVDALLRGEKKSALQALTMSIKLMKSALPDAAADDVTVTSSSVSSSDMDIDSPADGMCGCITTTTTTSCDRLPTTSIAVPSSVVASSNDDTIVFNQAIQIPIDSIPSSSSSRLTAVDMNIYTGAVIYNLALTHQSMGTQECLDKSEKLYGLVLKLLDASTLHTRTALIVKLGCINNLSQIRYSNGDYDNVQDGLSHVSNYFMSQQQQQQQDQDQQDSSSSSATMFMESQALFEEPMVQSLLMNVLLLRPPTTASAA